MQMTQGQKDAQELKIKEWAEKVGLVYERFIVYPMGKNYFINGAFIDHLSVDLSAIDPEKFMAVVMKKTVEYGQAAGRNTFRDEFHRLMMRPDYYGGYKHADEDKIQEPKEIENGQDA